MPFRSEAQRRYMHAKLPEIAHRWDREYGGKVESQMPQSKQPFGGALQRRLSRGKSMGRRMGQQPKMMSSGRAIGKMKVPGTPAQPGATPFKRPGRARIPMGSGTPLQAALSRRLGRKMMPGRGTPIKKPVRRGTPMSEG